VINRPLYRHYKGGLYEFLTAATDEETGDKVVVYQSVDTGKVWVRKFDVFYERVLIDHLKIRVPRFRRVGRKSSV
jgi:hypothetical protein